MSNDLLMLVAVAYLAVGVVVSVLMARAGNRPWTRDGWPFVVVWPAVVMALVILVLGKLLYRGRR